MASATVFISHIFEERDLAVLLKREITRWFADTVDTFVSADIKDVAAGANWLVTVDEALQRSSVMILCCSALSVTQPWINFEAGAAWMRRIPIVPVCHTGLDPKALPMPLGVLQAVRGSDPSGIEAMFTTIAISARATTPGAPFAALAAKIQKFETQYLSSVESAAQGGLHR